MDIISYLNLERALAVIKPHAFQHLSSILRRIHLSGFHILQERCVKLTAEQAESFLRRQRQSVKVHYEISMEINEFCSGPLVALCLARENAIAAWIELMGPEDCSVAREKAPTSLRALYGDDNGNVIRNAVYGSKCASDVSNELHFFFPNMIPESICRDVNVINDYLCHNILQPLTDALYELLKIKPIEPLEWIAKYILDNNGNQPIIQQQPCPEIFDVIKEMKKNVTIQEESKIEENLNIINMKCGCSMETNRD